MPTKYLGPADNFIYDGKAYRPGDDIPMTDAEVAHHAANGHRFEGNDPTALEGVVIGYTPIPVFAPPKGDRGETLELPEKTALERQRDHAAEQRAANAAAQATAEPTKVADKK